MHRVVHLLRPISTMRHGRGRAMSYRGNERQEYRPPDPSAMTEGQSEPWYSQRSQQRSTGRGRGGRRVKRGRHSTQAEAPAEMHRDLIWYRTLFGDRVDREWEEEQRQVEERLRRWPLEKLKREGFTLVHCRAKRHGRLFDRPIVRFSNQNGPLPFHLFSQGDLVTITKSSPLDRVDAEGVVYEKRMSFVSIVVERVPRDLTSLEWRLDKGTNKIAFERMQKALRYICATNHVLPPWLRPCILPSAMMHLSPEMQKTAPDVSYSLKASLMKSDQYTDAWSPVSAVSSMVSAVDPDSVAAVFDKLQAASTEGGSLNSSQLGAIRNGLESRLSLIQGPPGTGKTWTAVHLIKALRMLRTSDGPILATAQSNIAVDQLLSGCLKLNLKAVRLGLPVRVTGELQGRTLDAQIQEHPRLQEVEGIRDEIQSLHAAKSTAHGRDLGLLHRDLSIKSKELRTVMDTISSEVVSTADVVCATCIGAGSDLLEAVQFKFIVLDESTQCAEPEALVPLTKATEDASVVLIGDHQQLPPTVLSQETDSQRILGTSLFQRLAAMKELMHPQNGQSMTGMSSALSSMAVSEAHVRGWISHVEPFLNNIRTTMLREQYRMHPLLSEWPSQRFYGGLLVNAGSVAERIPPCGIPWPSFQRLDGQSASAPILFVSSSGPEEVSPNGQSKFNNAQAKIVVSIVDRLLDGNRDMKCSDIGIISPYTAQVQTIKNSLTRAGHKIVRDVTADDDVYDFLEVKTVDGYQGREKDVIILSTVRSNQSGYVGFLDDQRRFNVAVTRARKGLVIIGDPETLKRDPLWSAWLEYIYSKRYQIAENTILVSQL